MAHLESNRQSQGRKKINIEKIKDDKARAVTLSKRKDGIFKKAFELSLLCGTHLAIFIFTLSGRVVSFGHPSVDSVHRRFSDENPTQNLQEPAEGAMAHSALLGELNDLCDQKDKQAEIKKRRGKELKAARESSVLSKEKLSQLNLNELEHLKEKLEKLRDDVRRTVAERQSDGAGPSRTGVIYDVPEPSSPDQNSLANEESSPIPADWLSL